MSRKIPTGPWHVEYRQLSQSGVASRPVIKDAAGKTVSLNLRQNAVLMAAAPELLRLLDELADRCDFQARVLRGEHPQMATPECVALAQALIRRIWFEATTPSTGRMST